MSPVNLWFSETHVSSMGCMCSPLPFSLFFYSILVGKCVFNILNQRLCFHTTSTAGNSAPANNKKRLSDFNWKGVQDKCSVQCSTTGMWRCGSWAAVAIGKSCGCVQNTRAAGKIESSPRVWSSWDGCLGQLALWQCFMETWKCQHHIIQGHWVFKLPSENYKFGAVYSKVNDISCAQNFFLLLKKGREKKMLLFHYLQVYHLSGFPWKYTIFLLDIFSPS